jgi:hypothetical protein
LFLPAIQYVRMHPVFGGNLVDRFSSFRISNAICAFWLAVKCFLVGIMCSVYTLFLPVFVSNLS